MWWIGSSPAGRYFRHTNLTGDQSIVALVLAGWVVMVVAMMLPTTAPLVATFRTIVSGRRRPGRLVASLIGGYTAVWTLVGACAIAADDLMHRLVPTPRDGATPWVMVVVLAVSSVYQFTPLKRRCVDSCRSPFLFISQRWRGGAPGWEAFRIGVSHGWFCVGCCWTLMIVVFAIGMGNLGWMFVVSAVMAIEKNVARMAWIGPVLGVLLGGAAVTLAVW
jgi:predicted metal-binding membrane protein